MPLKSILRAFKMLNHSTRRVASPLGPPPEGLKGLSQKLAYFTHKGHIML